MTAANITTDLRSRFEQLQAPLPKARIQWRRDGKPVPRGNKWFARFVAYTDAQFVQERLDAVFLGDWHLSVEEQPDASDDDGQVMKVVKATLTILGLTRQDFGMGTTPKSAATDSFKRVAVRFGIGRELYELEQLYVEVDERGREVEEPALAYERLIRQKASASESFVAPAPRPALAPPPSAPPSAPPAPTPAKSARPIAPIPCPRCGGKMSDDRAWRTGKQPDYRCLHPELCKKDEKGYAGAVWLDDAERRVLNTLSPAQAGAAIEAGLDEPAFTEKDSDDDLPF